MSCFIASDCFNLLFLLVYELCHCLLGMLDFHHLE